jgi:hypothetical protein
MMRKMTYRTIVLAAMLALGGHAAVGVVVGGSVYGGGNVASVGVNTEVNITAGTVTKDVYGGGYGAATKVSGNVTVNIGAKTTGDTPTYSGSADIGGSVYGGSALGQVNTSTANTTTVNLYSGTIHGDAYGGGLGQIGREAKDAVESDPAHGIEAQEAVTAIEAVEAMVNGNVVVNQYGVKYEIGTVKENEDDVDEIVNSGRIFGCNNQNGSPLGSVDVNVYSTKPYSGDRAKGKYEIAAVYGGGNLAAYEPYGPQANGTAEDFKATTHFAHVTINGCDNVSIQQVYGGGNAASTPSTKVDIEGSYEIEEVFGGGNGKDRIQKNGTWMDNPGANVGFYEYDDNVEGRTDTKENRASYYGYGTGAANVNIKGGQIHRVFGGSNTKGNVRITAVTMLEDDNSCTFFKIDEAYGGGKSAPMDAEAKLLMACIPGLSAAYGGAEAADVQGGVTLSITNGTFDRVFGGNNISGTIGGPIVVNIEETGCKPIVIGQVYGGGNLAAYDGSPTINIKSFTSIGEIYGGGYGSTATVNGDTYVNINEVVLSKDDTGQSTDFSKQAFAEKTINYDDGSSVTVYGRDADTNGAMGVIGNIYGGGNEAAVLGNTHVNVGTVSEVEIVTLPKDGQGNYQKHPVKGADIRGNVYGGGNKAEVSGSTNVTIGK